MKKRVFSGIQPSGRPHLGNYLGAMRQHVAMQDEYDAIYGIVDYHAMTTIHDGKMLREYTIGLALDYMACGLDPQKCILVKQSDVPEHVQLSWILSSITPLAWVERTPSFKEKLGQREHDVNLALLSYPVLMAADILVYRAEVVPVGKDQLPHLELCREIARAFNRTYGDVFPEPQPLVSKFTGVVLGTDGVHKMSKSLGNTIELFADPVTLKKRVMSMVTDPLKVRRGDPGRPEVCNVFTFHKLFNEPTVDEVDRTCRTGELGCVEDKTRLFNNLNRQLSPLRERRAQLAGDPNYAADVLAEGARKARAIAGAVMEEVRQKTGLSLTDS